MLLGKKDKISNGVKKVMVFGTFDIIHPGHLDFFRQAKKYGQKLIVVIGRDSTVKKIKNKLPQNSEKDRQKLAGALRVVDQVVLGNSKDQMKIIRRFKPAVVCLGYDQKAFVKQLKLTYPDLKIVRLKPYKSIFYKSSKLK